MCERERWIERISREGISNDVRVQEAGAERGGGEKRGEYYVTVKQKRINLHIKC